MDLSIIIVSYNTKDLLRNCLNSVYDSLKGEEIEFEIIVVDNASSDGSVEVVKKDFPGVVVIENRENLGFSKANNQGIKIAKGRYVLLLNSDTIILDECITKVYAFAKSKKEAGIIGCKVLNPDGSLQFSCYNAINLCTEVNFFVRTILKDTFDFIADYKYMRSWKHDKLKIVGAVSGCFMLIRRGIFDQVGLLDETFFMYYEDLEFCERLKEQTKFNVYYFPEAEIKHLKGASIANDKSLVLTYKSARIFFNKRKKEKLFVTLCRIFWTIELFVLLIFVFNNDVRRKLRTIRTLYAS